MWSEIIFWTVVGAILFFGIVYSILGIGFFVFGIPFIPSEKKVILKMIELGQLKFSDVVAEIGCGDGRLVFLAEEKVKKVVGYEGVFIVAWWARLRHKLKRKKGKGEVRIVCSNFLREDLSGYDVIFAYLSPTIMKNFYEKKWAELKSGCRIISNSFQLPKGKVKPLEICTVGKYKIYVYEK